MEILIRDYRDSDRDELVGMNTDLVDLMSVIDVHKRFRPKDDFDARKDTDLLVEEMKSKEGKIFIAECDGQVAGYAAGVVDMFGERDSITKFPTKQGYIDAFFIKDAFRGKKIAGVLMGAVEEYFRGIGCEYSGVACVAANEAARKFYEKTGYGEQYINFLKKL